jgi:hypothetical protein
VLSSLFPKLPKIRRVVQLGVRTPKGGGAKGTAAGLALILSAGNGGVGFIFFVVKN